MISIQGKGVSRGVALGPVHFLKKAAGIPERSPAGNIAREQERVQAAQKKASSELRALAESCRANKDGEAADLFEAHALIAEDEELSERIQTILLQERCTAEYAVYQAGETFAQTFDRMEDSYMQARSSDVRDIAQRIIRLLTGSMEEPPPDSPVILAANDLSPAETLNLSRQNLLGFITRTGSEHSHTAIFARGMGIPAVCSVGNALTEEAHGCIACLDGETGEVVISPDEQTQAQFSLRRICEQKEQKRLSSLRDEEDVTPDGRRIDLYANIGSPEDIESALACGARGVGLFRSEFLFLNSSSAPTEDEQFEAYRAAAQAMNGRRVVIRTLDVGADKQTDYLRLPHEENPALGVRGVRLCMERKSLFRTQLRALYRASAYGNIAVMFPMITSEAEVLSCLSLCRDVMNALREEQIPFRPETEVGVMIETPAAALIADRLAQLTDFFSVGTNDLVQYTLACDRQNDRLQAYIDPNHPAIMRLIQMAADAAHQAGIWIGICGEMAADPSLLPTFLSMHIDELSLSPSSLLAMRAQIRSFTS